MTIHSEINKLDFAYMSAYKDENPQYWDDYDNLQRVKHDVLKGYLGGWFPILGSSSGKIVYIDCNAGRGRHKTGEPGSPLIAVRTFLGHPFCDRILKNCEVNFFFIEADEENEQHLEKIMQAIRLPPRVSITTQLGNFETVLKDEIEYLKAKNARMAPAFVFVDPYGFKLPGKLLAELKAFEKCELFITFMWRWIDMALRHADQADNMDALFVGREWRSLLEIENPDQRCEAAIRLLCSKLGARYFTRIKMLSENGTTKYVLIHATNHSKGRELMLEVMWKISPLGGFKVRINDNPDQEYLIEPSPNLAPLKAWLYQRYAGKTVNIEEIYLALHDQNDGTFYIKKHLHSALKELLQNGDISSSEKLVFKHNPKIYFRRSS